MSRIAPSPRRDAGHVLLPGLSGASRPPVRTRGRGRLRVVLRWCASERERPRLGADAPADEEARALPRRALEGFPARDVQPCTALCLSVNLPPAGLLKEPPQTRAVLAPCDGDRERGSGAHSHGEAVVQIRYASLLAKRPSEHEYAYLRHLNAGERE